MSVVTAESTGNGITVACRCVKDCNNRRLRLRDKSSRKHCKLKTTKNCSVKAHETLQIMHIKSFFSFQVYNTNMHSHRKFCYSLQLVFSLWIWIAFLLIAFTEKTLTLETRISNCAELSFIETVDFLFVSSIMSCVFITSRQRFPHEKVNLWICQENRTKLQRGNGYPAKQGYMPESVRSPQTLETSRKLEQARRYCPVQGQKLPICTLQAMQDCRWSVYI